MRSQEEVRVFVRTAAIDVYEEHYDRDRKPHDENGDHVQEKNSDDPNVFGQSQLLVMGQSTCLNLDR